MKRLCLTPVFLTLLAGTVDCARQNAFTGRQIVPHRQDREDVTAAARVKTFPQVKHQTDADYLRTLTEADLLSLRVCQGIHKMFATEEPAAKTNGLVDAEGAAECVVELQSALREISSTHPAYSDIRRELAWWNSKLMELDPADYHRLNS